MALLTLILICQIINVFINIYEFLKRFRKDIQNHPKFNQRRDNHVIRRIRTGRIDNRNRPPVYEQ